MPRKSAYHHDESVTVRNSEVVCLISELLRVKKETLLSALTAKHARASDETLVINYRLPEVCCTEGGDPIPEQQINDPWMINS